MMKQWMWWTCAAMVCAGCGGASEAEEPAGFAAAEPTGGAEEEPDDGVQIDGLMGTISHEDVQLALEPKMQRFAQCFANRYDDNELVGGHFQFSFRVNTDGTVKWVFPRRSTVGDRETERCLLEVAHRTRFRAPRGGEAEFNWSLDFDPPSDVRPPFNWDEEQAAEPVAEHASQVLTECQASGTSARFLVTAYVAPGGAVMTAGAAADAPEGAERLDCIAEAVQGWAMPDPGSYPAKITFVLQ